MSKGFARQHSRALKKAAKAAPTPPPPDLLTLAQVEALIEFMGMQAPVQLPPEKWIQVMEAAKWAFVNGYTPVHP